MKFVVSVTNLLSHLQSISRVISSKNTLAILDNFHIKIEGKELTATASDLETTLTTSLEIESSEGDMSFTVSAKIFTDILKEFPEQPLTIDINEAMQVTISSDNGEFKIIASAADEYPQVPALNEDEKHQITFTVDALESGLTRSIFATADDELRPVMNGIFFDITDEAVTFAASDAHKLVRIKNTAVKGTSPASFILHKKPGSLLKNILSKEKGNVFVEFDSKNACFTLSNYKMVCRLIDGRYPNYNSVIPVNNPNKMTVDRLSLMTTLKRVAVCSNQASNLVKISLTDNSAEISAQDIDFSISANESIPCQYQGEDLSIGFKSSFLIEILQNIDSADVILEFADSTRAGVILPFDAEEYEDVLMLLMPMMLND